MDEIGCKSSPIERVSGIGFLGGEVAVSSQTPKTGGPAGESGPSSFSTLEVAFPDLRKILEGLSSHSNIGLTYDIDRETHSVNIKVIDRDTNEVLREIPPEEMRRLRAAMREFFGSLFRAEV